MKKFSFYLLGILATVFGIVIAGNFFTNRSNIDAPSGVGDYELLINPCGSGRLMAVETRQVGYSTSFLRSGGKYDGMILGRYAHVYGPTYTGANNKGMYCANSENSGGCIDYEVRFLCYEDINTPTAGVCGSANGQSYTSYPTSNNCSAGTKIDTDTFGNDGTYNRTCYGINGGTNALCSANRNILYDGYRCMNSGGILRWMPTGLTSTTQSNPGTYYVRDTIYTTMPGSGYICVFTGANPVNGSCGSANGGSYTSAPGTNLCNAGSPSTVSTNTSTYTWGCYGTDGGTSMYCSATRIIESNTRTGFCTGIIANAIRNTVPAIRQYNSGGYWNPTLVATYNVTASTTECRFKCNAGYTWNGSACEVTATPVNGSCGTANGGSYVEEPKTNLCNAGTYNGGQMSPSTYTWTCYGINGGTNASCSANRLFEQYKCVSSGNQASRIPTGGPTSTVESPAGYYYVGTTIHTSSFGIYLNGYICSIDGGYDDACGTANGIPTYNYPSTNLCSGGTKVDIDTIGSDGVYNWRCDSSNGDTNVLCSAPKIAETTSRTGYCTGLIANAIRNTVPAIMQYSSGSYRYPSLIATYNVTASTTECRFKCNIGYTRNGSACILTATGVNGICGSANGGSYSSVPTTNLCSAGSSSTVTTNTSTYTWSCYGTNGGINASCSAKKISTRTGLCAGLIPNAMWNTAKSITQYSSGSVRYPSLFGTYNTTPSTTECRFMCKAGYVWNGKKCLKVIYSLSTSSKIKLIRRAGTVFLIKE